MAQRNYDPEYLKEKLSKEYAKRNGYTGFPGGWIYSREGTAETGVPVCQGWSAFWRKFRLRMLDPLARAATMQGTFMDLVESERLTGPALNLENWRNIVLAMEYNAAQRERGTLIRACCHNIPEGLMDWQKRNLEGEIR